MFDTPTRSRRRLRAWPAAALLACSLLAAEATHAKIVSNGVSLNGISLNGISLNGTRAPAAELGRLRVTGMTLANAPR